MTVNSIHPGVTREQVKDEHRLGRAVRRCRGGDAAAHTRPNSKFYAICTRAPRAPTAPR